MAKNKDESLGDPGEGPLVSDEEWAEFERSFTEESTKSAAYKEPSARQRELTAKWKREHPKDTGWRTDGAPTDLSSKRARGGSGGSGRSDGSGGSWASTGKRRRPWLRNLIWVLVALLVTAAIIDGPTLFSSSKSSDGAPPPSRTASSSGGPSSSSSSASSSSSNECDGLKPV